MRLPQVPKLTELDHNCPYSSAKLRAVTLCTLLKMPRHFLNKMTCLWGYNWIGCVRSVYHVGRDVTALAKRERLMQPPGHHMHAPYCT